MKKFFTFVLALVAVVAVNAKQVVFDFTKPADLGITPPAASAGTDLKDSIKVEDVVLTATNGSTATRIWNSNGNYDLRVYTNGTLTFTAEEDITAIEFAGSAISFAEFSGKAWTGKSKEVTVKATATSKITSATLTIGEEAVVWTPDTISVSAAVALIKEKDAKDHFVYGVVMGAPFITYQNFNGHASFWLADLENANDTIELYDGFGKNNAKWASLDEAKNTIHEGDTVLVYAGSLVEYTNSKTGITINEISGGYFAEMLGANPDAPQPIDDTPELPEGVISCDDAVKAAANIADPQEDKATVEGGEVKVRGYVTYAYDVKNGKQSAWLSDTKGSKSGVIEGSYLSVAEAVAVGDYVELAGTLAKYKKAASGDKPAEVIIEVINGSMTKIGADGKPIEPAQADTISVAQALRIGYDLLDNAVTEKKYVIDGYVSSIESYFDSQYKNETFWIADSLGSRAASNAEGAFYVYRGKPDTEKEIGLNAHVYVTVLITKYSKECKEPVIENSKSADVTVAAQGLEEKIDTITVAQAMAIGQAMEQGQATDNRYAITGYVSSIDVPFSEQFKNETFWITDTKDERTSDKAKAFYVYRGKPNVEKEIGLGAKISIVCKIKNFKGTIENDGMGIQFEVLEEGVAPEIKTITVTEAIELGMALEDGAYSEDVFVVKGYATKAYAPDSCKTSQNVYMADFPEAYGKFYAYNCSPDELVKDGDYIYVQGKIQKYVSAKGTTIEIGGGSAVHGEPEIISVNVAEATVIAKGLDLTPVKDSIVTVTAPALYEVTGYVIYVSRNGEYFMLADDANATESEFMAYKCYGDENVELAVGDQVVVLGAIQHRYDGTTETHYYQIGDGAWVLAGSQGIENVVLTEKAQKVVVDGALYIVRDNKMYNVQGVQVR